MSIYSKEIKSLGKNARKILRVRKVVNSVSSRGRAFGITFTKKSDGSERNMGCRRVKVAKYLKGGRSTIKGKKDLISVCETNKGYKCFSALKLKQVRGGGMVINFSKGRIIN